MPYGFGKISAKIPIILIVSQLLIAIIISNLHFAHFLTLSI